MDNKKAIERIEIFREVSKNFLEEYLPECEINVDGQDVTMGVVVLLPDLINEYCEESIDAIKNNPYKDSN